MAFPKYVSYSYTATADTAFQVTPEHLFLAPCDVFILSNDAYVGDGTNQTAPIFAGDVYTPQVGNTPVDISQIWFKNKTGGSNTQIVVVGLAIGYNKTE